MRSSRISPPKRAQQWARDHLSTFAARLCAELHGEALPKPPWNYRVGPGLRLTAEKWRLLLHTVLSDTRGGRTVERALRSLAIPEWLFRSVLRWEPRLMEAWRYAVPRSGRRPWTQPSFFEMDALCTMLVANPGMSARTACQLRGAHYEGFLRRTRRPEWEDRYLRAKRIQEMRSMSDLGDTIDSLPSKSVLNKALHRMRGLEPRRLWLKRTPDEKLARRVRRILKGMK